MRVAALYDIHGNLPALEAVLADVKREGVDLIVVGGDVVPGPMPRECVDVLRALPGPVELVHGNGETDVLALEEGRPLTRVPERFHDVMRWVAGELTDEQKAEMASWPLTVEKTIPGLGVVLFCHATPRDDNELFTRITPEQRVLPALASGGADLVVCGHTHMQFDRRIGPVRVVNAGSVGMPFGEPGAYWLLLGPDVRLRRTSYDLEAAARRVADTAYPQIAQFDVRRPAPEAAMLEVFEAAALK